jgi:predicted  nucleic acid-binding Zn-ribbon protein
MPQIKCTRCRHVHTEADRKMKRRGKNSVLWDTTCPQCGGKQYQQVADNQSDNIVSADKSATK